jgi:tRNA 5-methylaminomethyl-2-thiouridine biosynthesis bifunctional protein
VAEPVDWRADGTPHSPRFGDVYRSTTGGLAQARGVFLHGCGLPANWAGQRQWRILETGFGLGLNFLATWQAWRDDPQRPDLLHFVSVEAWPVAATDLLRSAARDPSIEPLARLLAEQWTPEITSTGAGVHRLRLEGGRVLLTLCVGDVQAALRGQDFAADSVFLDGFNPQTNPEMWSVHVMKSVARHARLGSRLATWSTAPEVRDALTQCGFVVERLPGLPPKRRRLQAVYQPHWTPRHLAPPPVAAGPCVVVGGGIAGAAVASSLALRGWQVRVLDAAAQPAAGASGLPAGLIAPHVTPDDAPLSRLTRAGMQAMLWHCAQHLETGRDWQATGLLEHVVPQPGRAQRALPAHWQDMAEAPSTLATDAQRAAVGLAPDARAVWHSRGAWVRPAALVHALLKHPGITWKGGHAAAALRRADEPTGTAQWQVLDAQGQVLDQAALVVVAAGFGSLALLPSQQTLPLNALRGQVTLGLMPTDASAVPPFPVNGHGALIAGVPVDGRPMWVAGSTFARDDLDTSVRRHDQLENVAKLATLLPRHGAALAALATEQVNGQLQGWAGVRATLPDRLPAVGPLDASRWPGLWACTGMGARGLTLAMLCGELLAGWLHHEPLPLDQRLAQSLRPDRFKE